MPRAPLPFRRSRTAVTARQADRRAGHRVAAVCPPARAGGAAAFAWGVAPGQRAGWRGVWWAGMSLQSEAEQHGAPPLLRPAVTRPGNARTRAPPGRNCPAVHAPASPDHTRPSPTIAHGSAWPRTALHGPARASLEHSRRSSPNLAESRRISPNPAGSSHAPQVFLGQQQSSSVILPKRGSSAHVSVMVEAA